MFSFRIKYTFPNDETEYGCNIDGHAADDAETRFLGGLTEDERQTITITSIECN